jgi:cob(I)alamin adenosyltransferase
VRAALVDVQHDLFDLGGELAVPGYTAMSERQVERLEALVATHNAALAPLKEFVLPGGTRPAALAHVCRTVCRRAERAVVALALADRGGTTIPAGGAETLAGNADALATRAPSPAASAAPPEMAGDPVRVYLNRLSDLLFVLARVLNRAGGRDDVLWTKGKNR